MPGDENVLSSEDRRLNVPAKSRSEASLERDPDVLLDVPKLHADNLELEVEDLELGGLLHIGKVRLHAENLEAELLLEADLDNLRVIVERLTNTANLGMSLFFAPVYGLTLWQTAAYRNLEIWQNALQAQVDVINRAGLPTGRRTRKR